MRIPSIFILFLLSLLSVTTIQAQKKKKILIEHAGSVKVDEEKLPDATVLTRDDSGQVYVIHDNIHMWCDKAVYYKKEDFIEAYGSVKMIQGDTITMTSKYSEYSGKTQLAFASGDVVLKDPTSTISSDTIYFDRLKQEAYYKSGGTVVKDTTVTITSKIGRHYMELKKSRFLEDVVLVSEDATINTNFFDFYTESGHAYLYGPSTITTEESVTYCEKGFYDTEIKIGYAMKKAQIDYKNQIIEGDSLYFDNNKSFASATNNIKVTDTLNHSIIKGHYAEVFKEKDSLFITKRALAIKLQEKDSVYMHADKITVTGKPENRIMKAYYNAKLFKSDLSAKADSIYSEEKIGLTKLINISKLATGDAFAVKRNPVLWNVKNQMTGDTINIISNTETEKIDSLIVFKHAMIISKDTLDAGYNQISGQKLIGLFNEKNKLKQVDIIKNAESIYYVRNENNELTSIDKAKSGSIRMFFKDDDIEEFIRLNQADGKSYPESKFPEKEKLFKGFDWREDERPRSVEDLFKDDPPFVLPIIKGLDDYVPEEDFFDDDLLDRIDKADKESNTKKEETPKASRNLPKKVKNRQKAKHPTGITKE